MSWIVSLLIVLGVILVSMILHELAHGVVAYWLGDDTAKREGRLTLNPLKHLDPVLSVVMPLLLLAMGMPIFGGAKPVPMILMVSCLTVTYCRLISGKFHNSLLPRKDGGQRP